MSAPAGRERTNRLRALPLTDILRAVGARPDPRDPVKWHTARGVLSVNGTKFFNWNETTGGGGAIDLAMHLMGLDFKEAIGWLAHLPAASPAAQAGRFALPPPGATIVPSYVLRRLVLPVPAARALPTVIGYLSGQRRLPLAQLQPLLDSGDLYADHKTNAVFLLRNEHHAPVGAELRGTGSETWRGLAPGSHKDNGYFAVGPSCPQAIVLCESAIDAISCRTLYPDRLCLSTSGARADPAWLPALLPRHLPIYCGFDDDGTGERMAQAMIARHPAVQRIRPPCHDWNDTLRVNT
jgi:hypothetical protein